MAGEGLLIYVIVKRHSPGDKLLHQLFNLPVLFFGLCIHVSHLLDFFSSRC